ncbi:TIR domain-containing protein [Streptomyces sp. NPDC004609]|uniref:caspase, EACC1-associated type n=1 Tax=Streptomyces sp. NPDC004609 TaxID=3364704 RepID=UPI0036BE008C
MGREFFVSHHPRDAVWADWIVAELRASGHDVELARDWEAGSNTLLNIAGAVQRREVVAVFSASYYEPLWDTTLHWTSVLAAQKRLIPLRIDDAERPPVLGALVAPSLAGLDEGEARRVLRHAVDPQRPDDGPRPFPGRSRAVAPAPASAPAPSPEPGRAATRATGPVPARFAAQHEPPAASADLSDGTALLVGVDTYDLLPQVPAIARNLTELRERLLAAGMRTEHCTVLRNPGDPRAVLDALQDTADRASLHNGTLVVYYAGHGALHPADGTLLLSVPDSRPHTPHSHLPFAQVRALIAECAAPRRLVVIDCCFSGAALDVLAGPPGAPAAVEGSFVMTSSAATELSHAPADEPHTAFTGALLSVLTHGIPFGRPVLDAESLYQAAKSICLRYGRPLPHRQSRNAGDRIPLMGNPWHRGPGPPPDPPRPTAPRAVRRGTATPPRTGKDSHG